MNLLDIITPKDQVKVVVSRFWNNPEITVTVNHEKIVLYANIEDFVNGMCSDMKPLIFTRKQLKTRMLEAMNLAIEKIKQASNA